MADAPYFYVYRDSNKEWRWRFRAANKKIIAVSSESYKARSDCEHGIALLKKHASAAPVIMETQT
jgi:uncharacterized protein YegP (UPF0339 family)